MVAVPIGKRNTVSSAGAWGVLRNMLQEFPGFDWAGADRSAAAASGDAPMPAGVDAFGCAAEGEPEACTWQAGRAERLSICIFEYVSQLLAVLSCPSRAECVHVGLQYFSKQLPLDLRVRWDA